jgi:hypothetical protein
MPDQKMLIKPRRFLKYLLCEMFGSVYAAAHHVGIHYNRLSGICAGSKPVRPQDLVVLAKGLKVSRKRMQTIIKT